MESVNEMINRIIDERIDGITKNYGVSDKAKLLSAECIRTAEAIRHQMWRRKEQWGKEMEEQGGPF